MLLVIRIFVVLCFVNCETIAQSIVSGTVTDASTQQPLPFSSVYINLTTIGAYSNEQGAFTLENIPPGRHELVVSHVGYVTSQTTIEVKDSAALTVNIKLATITLQEVNVSARRDKRWEEQLKRFNALFLGKNAVARQCRIVNPWVLEFSEDATGSFKASASSDLIIENLGLGYKISYQLKKFEFSNAGYAILGVTWFQQIPTYDSALLNLWARERRNVYQGSVTHLLSAITRNSLRREGFELYEDITNSPDVVRKATFTSNLNRSITPLEVNDLVRKSSKSGRYFISFPAKTEVHYLRGRAIPSIYRNVAVPISWIEIKKGSKLEVTADGIAVNPSVMTLSGAMSESKIADLLPIDYNPGKADRRAIGSQVSVPSNYLLERTHVHTDKTFYYRGEKLWLKAYVNYVSPAYQDTLSNTLYIDLVNEENVVMTSKVLLIDTVGAAKADIDLYNVAPGTYQLRSYTRWMLNYDKSFIFTKTIRILEDDELIASRALDTLTNGLLTPFLNKPAFSAGDVATLTLRTKDENGFAFSGNLSVAVTPLNYSSLAPEDPNISRLSFEGNSVHAPASVPYSIQYGIDISGRVDMKSRKKKYRQPIVMLAQEGTSDLISTRAAPDGTFSFNCLQLYDTMKLSMQAVSIKGNRRGEITIDSSAKLTVPPVPFAALLVEIVKTENMRRLVAQELSEPAHVLKEVLIEASSAPARAVGSAVHLQADVVISGEDLRKSDSGDLIAMIQAMVPGLRVLTFVENGIVRKFFKLGGMTTFDNNRNNLEPVVILDGSVLSNEWGESGAEQVGRLTVSMIDRIEVIKFGGAAAYGARGANGVIAIYTRTDFDKSKIVDHFDRSEFTQVEVRGYNSSRSFKGYSSYSHGSTIYWNPDIVCTRGEETTVKFLIPDVQGAYVVHVEGLSKEGRPLKAARVFTVK